MVANKSGLQSQTIKTILMAWVLTLPLTMLLSGGLFLISHHLFS
jgi:low-affinity inorganic phosphate transporter